MSADAASFKPSTLADWEQAAARSAPGGDVSALNWRTPDGITVNMVSGGLLRTTDASAATPEAVFDYIAQADEKNFRAFLVTGSQVLCCLFGIVQFLCQNLFVTDGFHDSLALYSCQCCFASRMSRSCVRLSPPQSSTTSVCPFCPK